MASIGHGWLHCVGHVLSPNAPCRTLGDTRIWNPEIILKVVLEWGNSGTQYLSEPHILGATSTWEPHLPRGHTYPGATLTWKPYLHRSCKYLGATLTQEPQVPGSHKYLGATFTQEPQVPWEPHLPRNHKYLGATLIQSHKYHGTTGTIEPQVPI